ncbi:ComF family protein [Marinomonas ostreistagni]|uniref:ComF family protein n=1 Tax=Marinomonas ostreistagni TaxID=359209 RepID=UPI00194E539B|nr:ComF family protein [Marinomonas ostreistagni]MBM6551232.1 ComF family protein [Marinomonas ostreistagni]
MTLPNLSTDKLKQVYKSLLFNQCYICDFRGEGTLCNHCRTLLSDNVCHCQRCARPTPIYIEECGECQRSQPAFDQVIAPLQYEGLCRMMISKAKFEQQPHLLRPLIELLTEQILEQSELASHWAIVPTSESSLKQRGFCQTDFMRQQLIALLRKHHPNTGQILTIERRNPGQAQHNLGRKERTKLSHKQFHIATTVPQHVVLIDDIITTGSTIQACSQALKLAGAERVTVWALARTPEQTGDLF